jgi:hypothetical protein
MAWRGIVVVLAWRLADLQAEVGARDGFRPQRRRREPSRAALPVAQGERWHHGYWERKRKPLSGAGPKRGWA